MQTTNLGVRVRISSGAPLPNKTGHSGWNRPAAHHQPFENRPAANDADFRVIDFDLIDDRADIGPPEWRFAREYVRAHDFHERSDFVFRDPGIWAQLGDRTVESNLRDIALGFHRCDALF